MVFEHMVFKQMIVEQIRIASDASGAGSAIDGS